MTILLPLLASQSLLPLLDQLLLGVFGLLLVIIVLLAKLLGKTNAHAGGELLRQASPSAAPAASPAPALDAPAKPAATPAPVATPTPAPAPVVAAAPAPVAKPVSPEEPGFEELLPALIAAAVHVALKGVPHKILRIEPISVGWAREGRRDIFSSHRVR